MLVGIKRADKDILKVIYQDYLPGLVYYVEKNNGSSDDAKDLFQEAIMVIYKKVQEGLILEVPLKAFFMVICRNLWNIQLRHKKRRPMKMEDQEFQDQDHDLVQKMEQTLKEKIFYKHFNNLSDKCRDLLQLFFAKIPMKDIAQQWDTSESYIKKRKHICKEKLVEAIMHDALYKEMKTYE